MISVAIRLIDLVGFLIVDLPVKRLFTSARTFSYVALSIPSDLRLFSCPLPCFPSITSCAICDMLLFVVFGLLAGFFCLVDDLALVSFLPANFSLKSPQETPFSPLLKYLGLFFPLAL